MKKEKYTAPDVRIIAFDNEDIITSSNETDWVGTPSNETDWVG